MRCMGRHTLRSIGSEKRDAAVRTLINSWTNKDMQRQSWYSCMCGHHSFLACTIGVRSAKRRHQSPAWTVLNFWATSIASFGVRLLDFRPCWIVFVHVVQGCPGGLLLFFKGNKLLKSSWYLFCPAFGHCGRTGRDAVLGQQQRCGCLVVRLTSSFRTWWFDS